MLRSSSISKSAKVEELSISMSCDCDPKKQDVYFSARLRVVCRHCSHRLERLLFQSGQDGLDLLELMMDSKAGSLPVLNKSRRSLHRDRTVISFFEVSLNRPGSVEVFVEPHLPPWHTREADKTRQCIRAGTRALEQVTTPKHLVRKCPIFSELQTAKGLNSGDVVFTANTMTLRSPSQDLLATF